jgi:hypothetical protein
MRRIKPCCEGRVSAQSCCSSDISAHAGSEALQDFRVLSGALMRSQEPPVVMGAYLRDAVGAAARL